MKSNDKTKSQIIKTAKCCFNCLYFNNSIDSLKGYCYLNPDNIIDVYPYEYCNLFKYINIKKHLNYE